MQTYTIMDDPVSIARTWVSALGGSPGGASWQPEAGEGAAATATGGVYVVSVSSASGCGAVLQRWRIEPVDTPAIVGESS